MSRLIVAQCDLCSIGSTAELGTDPDEVAQTEGLVTGESVGLPHLPDVHPSCAAEHRRSGASGDLLVGLPGLATP